MITQTFINLQTHDIKKSRAFFTGIALDIVEDFSDEATICVKINDTTVMMIMTKDKFVGFTKTETPNSFNQTEVIISFQFESKALVDQLLSRVIVNGGYEFDKATENDYMYYRSFRDLDGHRFEAFYYKA